MAGESLGQCVARIGQYMPVWAPRRGARCEANAALVRECTVGGRVIALPLCAVHDSVLQRGDADGALAATWAK
jgi:hypothetical protein